jgi:hypothetical protein
MPLTRTGREAHGKKEAKVDAAYRLCSQHLE